MSEWRTIDTAPRDGSWFVICRAGEPQSPETGCFDPMMWTQYEDAGGGLYRKVEAPVYDWRGFNNMHRATHWMPLPELPK